MCAGASKANKRQIRTGKSTIELCLFLSIIAGIALLGLDLLGVSISDALADKQAEETAIVLDADEAATAASPQSLPGNLFNMATPSRIAAVLLLFAVAAAWRSIRQRARAASAHEEIMGRLQGRFDEKRDEITRSLKFDVRSLIEDQLIVANVMTRHITAVSPPTPVAELRKLLAEHGMHHMLVCGPQGELLGVVSDRDILRRTGKTAADLMTADPSTTSCETPLRVAVNQMLDRRISCLPVVYDNAAVGIITTTDFVMTLQCALQVIRGLFHEMANDEECQRLLARR